MAAPRILEYAHLSVYGMSEGSPPLQWAWEGWVQHNPVHPEHADFAVPRHVTRLLHCLIPMVDG
jgi:hypothetical protein